MRSLSIAWADRSAWEVVRGGPFFHVSLGRLSITLWRLDVERLVADLLEKAGRL
mgnify:FL=1